MDKIVEKKLCTGCSACYNVCPKNAISMITDEDGFKYPVIDHEKCINCGLCQKLCPVLNTKKNISLNECYVCYSKDEEEKMKASSGAIFSLLANYILETGGEVVGAGFDDGMNLSHIAVSKSEELDKLKGSKYLQSDLTDIFKYIKDALKQKKILFVGTPCQVAGLKSFVKNDDNLYVIDLVCHGVPSPKLFSKFIKEIENRNNDKVIDYKFRDKSTGWDTYSNNIILGSKNIIEKFYDNNYMKLFLSDVALRESCFSCNFKLGNKYSDITLGDFWGVQNCHPDFYNKSGVSAVIVNTEKGKELFGQIKNNIIYRESDLNYILSGNSSLKNSAKKIKQRKMFFNDIDKYNMNTLTKKYVKRQLFIKKFIVKILKLIKR